MLPQLYQVLPRLLIRSYFRKNFQISGKRARLFAFTNHDPTSLNNYSANLTQNAGTHSTSTSIGVPPAKQSDHFRPIWFSS